MSDGELELDLSDVELFQDKTIKDIDWISILPTDPESDPNMGSNYFTPASILRSAHVTKHSHLIRNSKIMKNLRTTLEECPEVKPTHFPSRYTNLDNIIKQNRKNLGMDSKIPLRPFFPPSRLNGTLAHEVTQFILNGQT